MLTVDGVFVISWLRNYSYSALVNAVVPKQECLWGREQQAQ